MASMPWDRVTMMVMMMQDGAAAGDDAVMPLCDTESMRQGSTEGPIPLWRGSSCKAAPKPPYIVSSMAVKQPLSSHPTRLVQRGSRQTHAASLCEPTNACGQPV